MAFHAPQIGRPKATEGTKRILLRESTFRLWNERKERLNIKGLSNSQFAEILLHQNIEELRARSSSFQETSNDNEEPISSRRELFQSTPVSKRAKIEFDVSPVVPGGNEEDTNTLHTSKVENFNSMLLKYASKRIAFSYEVFTGRCLLAVLDHNFHLFRKEIEGKFKKLYSRRSGNWRVEAVKEDKSYSYWPALIAEILCKRAEDPETAARHVIVSPTNPQHLAPTIAMRESPATEDLVAARLSRFKKQMPQKSE